MIPIPNRAFILITVALWLPLLIFGQCPGDNCEFPQHLYAPSPFSGVSSCSIEVCNGEFTLIGDPPFTGSWSWECEEEDDGDTSGCFSQEHDYFVMVHIPEDGPYFFDLTSDYEASPFLGSPGGIQMIVYDTTECGEVMPYVQTAIGDGITNCSYEDPPTYQNALLELLLEEGSYLVQIDGFGRSGGCSQLCIESPEFLTIEYLPINEGESDEQKRNIRRPRKIFHPDFGFVVIMPDGRMIDATFRQLWPK